MSVHTLTPWVAEVDTSDNALCIHNRSDDGKAGYYIARMIGGYSAEKADADFIVRACNVHDELVAALRTARDSLNEIRIHCIRTPWHETGPAIAQVDAALAKAGAA